MEAFSRCGDVLEYASERLKNDKDVVLAACSQNSVALYWASQELRNDREFALLACSRAWRALEYASEELRDEFRCNKQAVLATCAQNGQLLQYASENLRADKEVVMAAVESNPVSLKYALGGLNKDKDCLIKAKLWDEDYVDRNSFTGSGNAPKTKIVLSTKFSLAAESSPHATEFTVELKKHPYIKTGGFAVYSPNAFNKGTCDPKWTDKNWPCRGTYDSCRKPTHLKSGIPQESECCWRYSFRYHLEDGSDAIDLSVERRGSIRRSRPE